MKFKLICKVVDEHGRTINKEIFVEDIKSIECGSCEEFIITLHDDTTIGSYYAEMKEY